MDPHPDPTAPAGWRPDPTGTHQWRYFDGSWTGHVADDGRISHSPPVPPTPERGAAPWPPPQAGLPPRASPPPPEDPDPSAANRRAPRPRPRSRVPVVVGVVAVAAVVIVAVVMMMMTGGGASTPDGQAGDSSGITGDFCADFPANYGVIEAAWQTASTISSDREAGKDQQHDAAQLARASDLMRRLAAEAPATTDMFGAPLSETTNGWAEFYAAARDVAANTDYDDVALHDRLLAAVHRHQSDSSPSLLRLAMFPDPGLPTQRPCG